MTLPPDQIAEIRRIVARLGDQDNRCTQHVAFHVQKAVMECGFDTQYTDEIAWLDGGHLVNEDHWGALNEAYANNKETLEIDGECYRIEDLERTGYRRGWETVTVCFTEEGAEAYLAANGHNLRRWGEPRIYGESFHRNREMIAIRESLPALLDAAEELNRVKAEKEGA